MFGERGLSSLINLTRSLWKRTSTNRPLDRRVEPTITPNYVPQAYPNGFPFGRGKPVSDHSPESEDCENERP